MNEMIISGSSIVTKDASGQPVTTSLAIAKGTEVEHKAVMQLVRKYQFDLSDFGGVTFEMAPFETAGGTQTREIAILNEQQSTLLISYMANSDIVRSFKKALVKGFYEMRAALVATLPDFSNPAAAARAWADAHDAKNAALALAGHAIATKAEIGNRREATAMNTASLRIVSEFPRYLVSRDGEVYVTTKTNSRTGEVSLRDVPKKLKHVLDVYGYRIVSLRSDGAKKVAKVHRLVASAFLENPEGKPQVNHINGIRHDSRAANLEWVTGSENQIHAHQVLHTKANSYWTGKENKHLQKPVAQVSLDGVLMRIWPSMKSISISGAACKSSVEKSLKSGKPTSGFYLYHADVWREVYALPIDVAACEGVAA